MSMIEKAGTYKLAGHSVNRLGYGAMQLAGEGVFGPPKDRREAVAVLREAVASGVNHIDTSDFYGPHITNQIVAEALAPYPEDLVIVTKVGAFRGSDKSWNKAMSPKDLEKAVHDNLRNLKLDVLEVVNFRSMHGIHEAADGPIEEQVTALAELQQRGLIRHVGLSNVTGKQVAESRKICDIVCVQNFYNLANRHDDALIDELALQGTAYVPFFPLGGFSPLQSDTLNTVAKRLHATPMAVALSWLLHRSRNILLIPGTSSLSHLRENLGAVDIALSDADLKELDDIGSKQD